MKINLLERLNSKNIVQWAIIHMMAKHSPRINIPEWKHSYEGGTMNIKNLDVVLKIEGVEVDFIECIEEINRQHNNMVREDAKKLVDEQFSDLHEKSKNLMNLIDNLVESKKKELGLVE